MATIEEIAEANLALMLSHEEGSLGKATAELTFSGDTLPDGTRASTVNPPVYFDIAEGRFRYFGQPQGVPEEVKKEAYRFVRGSLRIAIIPEERLEKAVDITVNRKGIREGLFECGVLTTEAKMAIDLSLRLYNKAIAEKLQAST